MGNPATRPNGNYYYTVQMRYKNKLNNFGSYNSPQEAARVADVVVHHLFGELLTEEDYNFPDKQRELTSIPRKWQERVKALLTST